MSSNMSIKSTIRKTDDAVESIKKPAFLFTVGITYISYIFLFLGIFDADLHKSAQQLHAFVDMCVFDIQVQPAQDKSAIDRDR